MAQKVAWEVRTTALFKAWTAYAEAAGEKPGTRPSFRERMRAAGLSHFPVAGQDHRRVAAGDCSPAAPTDPDLPNSGIRLLGL